MKTLNIQVGVILIYGFNLCECVRNNVCKTFQDYRTISTNPDCWYNPDLDSGAEEIARRYGFPFESYEVTTKDGYVVTLFRIPHNGTDSDRERPIVFFQHGIAVDGLTWMTSGLKSSVFVFSNRGYDVWVSNCRGTEHSSKHVKYSVYDREYWIYSFHELAIFDLPAMLDFIVKKTNQNGNVTFIGHSMGSTMALIYTSLMPEHSKKTLKTVIALAPVAYMDHVSSALRLLVPYRYLIWDLLSNFGLYGLGPHVQHKLDLMHRLCASYPFIEVCATTSALFAGINMKEALPSDFPLGIRRFGEGVSLKTIFHYGQILATKRRFQFFDYGPQLNRILYNASIPPEYPLEQIKVPVHLFYGKRDLLSREKDVYYLYDKLQTEKSIMEVLNFAHLDFVGAVHLSDLYQILFKYI